MRAPDQVFQVAMQWAKRLDRRLSARCLGILLDVLDVAERRIFVTDQAAPGTYSEQVDYGQQHIGRRKDDKFEQKRDY